MTADAPGEERVQEIEQHIKAIDTADPNGMRQWNPWEDKVRILLTRLRAVEADLLKHKDDRSYWAERCHETVLKLRTAEQRVAGLEDVIRRHLAAHDAGIVQSSRGGSEYSTREEMRALVPPPPGPGG